MGSREIIAGVVAGIVVVALLAVGVGWEQVLDGVLAADKPLFGLALLAGFGSIVAWGLSVYALVRPVPDAPGLRRFGHLYLAAVFVKQAIPFGVAGGAAVLAYVISRYSDTTIERTLLATTVAGFLSTVASALVAGLGLLFVLLTRPIPQWILQLTVALAIGLLMLIVVVTAFAIWPVILRRSTVRFAGTIHPTVSWLSARVGRLIEPTQVRARLDRFIETGEVIARDPRAVVGSFAAAVLAWVFTAAALSFSLAAVGSPGPLSVSAFAVTVSGVATAVPLPGGLGGVEATLSAIVTVLTGDRVATVSAGIVVFRLATFWLRLVVGGPAGLTVLGRYGSGSRALDELDEIEEGVGDASQASE
ncbi:lysylphosphatidylglycerol synthase transmembrane domain-containing protein [Haloarchaeobius salinus]|uniref:lysylphosphatidylglycerol synthase transmembrane domain-containing protein n=1 Tax=Haloarchaeobius salinus TaxID=1198298 RepID=UPI00210AED9D|nr:lysylphosphatidylglycerol synthase transmembrane domain-containing protein [Haloarchaeobius salinus]